MGSNTSTPKPATGRRANLSTVAPTISSAPCLSNHPNKEHLILAFFVGVLLTLMLMALVFLIIKIYRKSRVAGHSSPQTLDPHSDPRAELSSIPEESLTYTSMAFKMSEEKSNHLTKNHSADLDPIVYAQIKVTNSPCLSNEP
ncbi:PREDICTED: transmembrane protein C1orf162 homolog [Galeopterus variegatus]|uniref:Transmembrane protein C1orf162 homolog n=1 Tax=Galeopterus variegatus TaxID=482537 RepID=A0ABM0QPN1_GALVR|nr:PREDICTED: transmembrane protein C1orf162 homolog [Galeopterus variegatus]